MKKQIFLTLALLSAIPAMQANFSDKFNNEFYKGFYEGSTSAALLSFAAVTAYGLYRYATTPKKQETADFENFLRTYKQRELISTMREMLGKSKTYKQIQEKINDQEEEKYGIVACCSQASFDRRITQAVKETIRALHSPIDLTNSEDLQEKVLLRQIMDKIAHLAKEEAPYWEKVRKDWKEKHGTNYDDAAPINRL